MKLPSSNDPAVQEVLDREAIRDCLYRYCRGIDRCDEATLLSAYWPGAIDDHVFFKGPVEEFVKFALPFLRGRDQTMHSITNEIIRISGNTALVESQYIAYERIVKKDGTRNDMTASGRYIDRFEKRDGEWRIADRKITSDWFRIYDDSADWARGLFGTKLRFGKREKEDISYELFGSSVV